MKIKKANMSRVAIFAILFGFSFVVPMFALATLTPSLGAASTYGVLSSTYTNTAGTTINGDIGYTTPPVNPPTINGTTHVADSSYNQAGSDQNSALSSLNSQSCTSNFNSPTDLSLLPQPLVPGVYCITAATSIGTAGITLNGSGTYIFKIAGALTTVVNSNVALSGGAAACNVFWAPSGATTLGANSSFLGTVIDPAGITLGSTVSWQGKALAFGGTVTTNTDTITVSSCSSSVGTAISSVTPLVVNQPIVTTPTPIIIPVITTPIVAPVVIPTLPKTGFPPEQKNNLWNIIQNFFSSFF